MNPLAREIVEEVKKRSSFLKPMPSVQMVAISLGYTFVELDNGILGVCFTPRSTSSSCTHYPGAGSLTDKPALDLAGLMLSDQPLERSVGIAAVNALSQSVMDNEPESFRFSEQDFLELLPVRKERLKVGMVGNIGPFLPFLIKHAGALVIIDDNPSLPEKMIGNGYSVHKNIEALSDADVLIITGSAAAVGDFDEVLEAAPSARFVGVVGPSAGWLPDPAFRRGVHAVAATRIVDMEGARRTILEGGGTSHFMAYGRKYTLIPNQTDV